MVRRRRERRCGGREGLAAEVVVGGERCCAANVEDGRGVRLRFEEGKGG